MGFVLIHIIPIEFLFLGDFFSVYKEKKSQERNAYFNKYSINTGIRCSQ